MLFHVNPSSGVPIYLQIEAQIKNAIAAGALKPGQPGGGTFVAEGQPRFLKSERRRRLQPYARQIAVEGTQLGLSETEIVDLVQEELAKVEVHR